MQHLILKNFMKKFIIERIKEKIKLNQLEYADNFIAKIANEQLTTPEAKKQVESAEHKMKTCLERISFLETLLKNESK